MLNPARDKWWTLQARLGGVGKLASLLCVTSRTIQRWTIGDSTPNYLERVGITTIANRLGLESPVESWALLTRVDPSTSALGAESNNAGRAQERAESEGAMRGSMQRTRR
jgi:hypothetical protein